MNTMIKQAFRSGKFLVGFVIFMVILLMAIIYPLIVRDPPLAILGQGTFFEPGIYVNVFDAMHSKRYKISLENAAARRIASKLGNEERADMKTWLRPPGSPRHASISATRQSSLSSGSIPMTPTKTSE